MEPLRPWRDDPGNRVAPADDEPAERERAVELLGELAAIVAEIEAAPAGGAALDARIHFGFRVMAGHGPDIAALLIGEGISWPTVQAALDEAVPPYTTSLDAAVEGEHIVFVLRSARRGCWGAMQRTASGRELMGWAATEPLARRLAALKCWQADIAAALEEDGNTAKEEDDGRQSPGMPASASGSGTPAAETATAGAERVGENEKDWEVLF